MRGLRPCRLHARLSRSARTAAICSGWTRWAHGHAGNSTKLPGATLCRLGRHLGGQHIGLSAVRSTRAGQRRLSPDLPEQGLARVGLLDRGGRHGTAIAGS